MSKDRSPQDLRRLVEGIGAIGAARKETPEFGCAIADAVILAFVGGQFAVAAILADSLLVLPDEHAHKWAVFAGVVRFHAFRNMTKDERYTMIELESEAAPEASRARLRKDLFQ